MTRSSHKRILILNFLFFLGCFYYSEGRSYAQQAPEPVEGRMAGQAMNYSVSKEPGLLFYLSGNKGFTADFASGGQTLPNFLRDVTILTDGDKGPGFKAGDNQVWSYWASGNIYAQRGTLSFFWRSRYPVGPTPFPVFRVGYADHSSWDMVWLRIDYNGSGFDAFVTDIGLSRTRVSYFMDKIPAPDEWIHIAMSWDETEGIRFYINGELVARQSVEGTLFDTGLDQFGPHSRVISPYQVQSAYNFVRGGDIDEIRIYDHMLSDESIQNLSKGNSLVSPDLFKRDLTQRKWRDEWWLMNGWNLPNEPPPLLPASETKIRKVEIHDAYDIKRWYWKANDGIRETTWPGVYNMSRLPGRYDYFVLPDWDCYSGSGQSVRFTIPDEPWNRVEMWGKAWGQLTYEDSLSQDYTFGVRSRTQIKSYHALTETHVGGKIRFDNALIEEPIGSLEVYYIDKGTAPAGALSVNYTLNPLSDEPKEESLHEVSSFIRGRYPADEQAMMIGVPTGDAKNKVQKPITGNSYPFIHILIPYADNPDAGLDGIEIQLPAMNVKPTHKGVFPVNIRVKDPLWQMRDLADFSFSVKPGDSPKLWIDTRDRVLPKGRALYLTIAGAGSDFTTELLQRTKIRLIYKSFENARTEHEIDRFTQVRDLYAHIVEEHPYSPRLNLYNRFMADCNDLLAVAPDNWLAQTYRYAQTGRKKPEYKIPECPPGIPEWAFLQTEYLRHLENIVNFYIDKRQISNGEFGGGLSDDGDLTNMWPGIAYLGIEPDKILKSLLLHMKAYYDPDRPAYYAPLRQRSLPLLTNGLVTIFVDELHALEDGLQVVGQLMLFDYGNPLHIERGMETASRMLNDITQVNFAGHRHFRSLYYGATRMATEDPWQWSLNHSYHVLQTSYLLARYNGNPEILKMITDMADALLAHRRDGKLYTEINFATDEPRDDTGNPGKPWSLFYAAYFLTGDKKYLDPVPPRDLNKRKFNEDNIARNYRDEITNLGIREYINTEGSIWIDRITAFSPGIQEDRLGGIALIRINTLYPQHFVSWRFNAPATYASAGIFVPDANQTKIDIIAYNLDEKNVNADMTVWDIKPGKWRLRQGIDNNNDLIIDGVAAESMVNLKQGESINLNFAARKYNLVSLELIEPSEKGLWDLPDPGIGTDDVNISGNRVTVRVHNIGAVASGETTLELRDAKGNIAASVRVPALEAPLDLKPRWKDIIISVTDGTDLSSGSVEIDPERKMDQITRRNDIVRW
jgi:hypothetical protein